MLMSVGRKPRIKVPVIFGLVILIIVFIWLIIRLGPVYTGNAASYVYSHANATLNSFIYDYCNENSIEYNNFINMTSTSDGKISAINTNSTAINRFKSKITSEIESVMLNEFDGYVRIPIGSVLGTPIFSDFGPKLKFKVMPVGKAEINISGEFTDAGINQVCHSLYLDTKITYSIINSVFTHNEIVNTRFLIGETVIVGDVPKFYGSNAIMQEDYDNEQ